jgi:hypothetical protein
VPELAQTMIAQIWCAHPSNRTKYMVLDPKNWDAIPAPLISSDIFGSGTGGNISSGGLPKRKSSGDNPDFPWL